VTRYPGTEVPPADLIGGATEAAASDDPTPPPSPVRASSLDPRAVLRAAGVASPAAIEAAQLHDVSRSHDVALAVLPDGSRFIIKRASDDAHATGRSLAAELYAYRLASWRPAVAAVLPKAVHIDERRQVLVLVAAPSSQLFPAHALRPGFPTPDLAAALGRSLATLHGATEGVPLATVASQGVVDVPDTPEADRQIGGNEPAAIEVARTISNDTVIAEALRRCSRAMRPSCLVHADLKWDNMILDDRPPAQVALFDWELSGLGDPAWDVGSALADTVSLRVRLEGRNAIGSDPAAWLTQSLRAFLWAYGAGTRELGDDLSSRVVLSWVARLVHLSVECAASIGDAGHTVVLDLLETARTLAMASDTMAASVDTAMARST
jgi:hypothetical protein